MTFVRTAFMASICLIISLSFSSAIQVNGLVQRDSGFISTTDSPLPGDYGKEYFDRVKCVVCNKFTEIVVKEVGRGTACIRLLCPTVKIP